MELFQDIQPLTLVFALGALVVGWILLRILLKLTVRVFACGCLVLLFIGGGAYLLTALAG
jgi:hypothetical protein